MAEDNLNRWFSMRVHAELKARGWSSRELSRRAECSASTFTRVKQGRGIALAAAARIADALGMPLGDLIAPVTCTRCTGKPPAGFTCQECGTEGASA
jgi:lambda repressor-like predicted transcriptional regulator